MKRLHTGNIIQEVAE